jgi:hypothetical protein
MGFNLRTFNIEMLTKFYLDDKIEGIGKAIGKTDGFIFADKKSSRIVNNWLKGNREKATQIIEEHVSRITTQTSSDNR